ncbi:unnamed protein product [Acanthoscelides obtectus]|uniref:Pre-C2HC domain-containing protein n=1 Tax=Acanthoscelides obtectus TaxID=200917 RepID=A0A9P0PT87_ACAOB|nr:unnamed protein product [Acanthoscelides obtectus]CAK1632941.1 hypothetical protein AOBTE_LOCUS7836 [Acanthoscelides obtectus]
MWFESVGKVKRDGTFKDLYSPVSVREGDSLSASRAITSCVPQGYVVGPMVPEDTTAQPPRKVRVTPIVLRDASRWRGVNHKFISLGIKFERAVAVDAGIRIIPKSENDYRRIIRLFREEEVPHHTFPLPSERNIHAVIRGVHATLSEIEIKEELQQRGYSPLHIIRLKRGGGVPMPLVVVILPKIEKSQQLFNEHELLGTAMSLSYAHDDRVSGSCLLSLLGQPFFIVLVGCARVVRFWVSFLLGVYSDVKNFKAHSQECAET